MSEEEPQNDVPTLDFSELHRAMTSEHTVLMDISHEAMQYARKAVWAIRDLQERFDDHCEELVDLHITKAAALTQIAENLIMAEFDVEPAEEEESGEEEDE